MGQVLEQVELGHDADRPPAARGDDGRGVARQQREGLVEGGVDVDERQRPVHHLADRPLDDRRVAERAIEQALLGDRADDALDRVAVGLLGHRQLADAVRPGGSRSRRRPAASSGRGRGRAADPRGGGRASRSPTRTTAPVVAIRPFDPHPLVVVDLRQVAPAAVGQEHDDDRRRAPPAPRSGRGRPRARRPSPCRTSRPTGSPPRA